MSVMFSKFSYCSRKLLASRTKVTKHYIFYFARENFPNFARLSSEDVTTQELSWEEFSAQPVRGPAVNQPKIFTCSQIKADSFLPAFAFSPPRLEFLGITLITSLDFLLINEINHFSFFDSYLVQLEIIACHLFRYYH